MSFRAGSVALLGWTNVGKSTLLNRLVGDKLAAVADVAQTTRKNLRGVLHLPGGQIAFVDTPGLHRPKYRMNRAMVDSLESVVGEVDLVALVVDAEKGPGPGDAEAARLARRARGGLVVVLNKSDRVRPKSRLLPMMDKIRNGWGVEEILPISARTGDGCEALVAHLLARMPESAPLYPEDFLTDGTERDLAAEWIREKILTATRQELPHATAVLVESWQEREDGLVEIHAGILVERDSQKQIVIGRGGAVLREVGSAARRELEALLGRQVFLKLWVRTRRDWRNDERVLRELGIR